MTTLDIEKRARLYCLEFHENLKRPMPDHSSGNCPVCVQLAALTKAVAIDAELQVSDYRGQLGKWWAAGMAIKNDWKEGFLENLGPGAKKHLTEMFSLLNHTL